MWEKINNFLKGQIVTSIIYIALGACLVFMPVSTVNVICKFVFGILLILVGLYHILIYVAEKLNSTIFDLFSGGVLMVLGIFLFMNPADCCQASPNFAWHIYSGGQHLVIEGKPETQKTWCRLLEVPSSGKHYFHCTWYLTGSKPIYNGEIHGNLCRMDIPL